MEIHFKIERNVKVFAFDIVDGIFHFVVKDDLVFLKIFVPLMMLTEIVVH